MTISRYLRAVFADLSKANRLTVTSRMNRLLRETRDDAPRQFIHAQLAQLEAGWQPDDGRAPIPRYHVNFYQDEEFLGLVGLERGVFTLHGQGRFWYQPVADGVYMQWLAQVGLDIVRRNPRERPPETSHTLPGAARAVDSREDDSPDDYSSDDGISDSDNIAPK